MHPPPASLFQPPPSSLQHPRHYQIQNITCNWAISSNLGGKFKVVHLPENWHAWYLGHADSKSGLKFLKFRPKNPFLGKLGPKKSKLSLKIGTHSISSMLILIPRLVFRIFNPKSTFGQIWVKKSQRFSFCLKIGTHSISRMMILISTLIF